MPVIAFAEIAPKVLELLAQAFDRSVAVTVANHTDATLKRGAVHHESGEWAVPPSSEIPPGMADVFSAKSASLLDPSVEGQMLYSGLGLGLNISWLNPAVGNNQINSIAFAGTMAPLQIARETGGGNRAHMKYEIFQRALTWFGPGPQQAPPIPAPAVAQDSSPSSWYSTPENVQHIAYVNVHRRIHELLFKVGGSGKWDHVSPPTPDAPLVRSGTSPTTWYTTPENVQHIAYVGVDGKVHELFFKVGETKWRHGGSHLTVGAPLVLPGTSPTSWYSTPENVQHIAYVGNEDRKIHELSFKVGGSGKWEHGTANAAVGAPPLVLPGTSPTSWYTTPENVQHIAYVGNEDRKIHELSFKIGSNGKWTHGTAHMASGPPVLPGTSPTSWYSTPLNVQNIAYVGENRVVHEIHYFIGGPNDNSDRRWHGSIPGDRAPLVAPGTSPTSWYTTPENVQHVAYTGADGGVHERFLPIR